MKNKMLPITTADEAPQPTAEEIAEYIESLTIIATHHEKLITMDDKNGYLECSEYDNLILTGNNAQAIIHRLNRLKNATATAEKKSHERLSYITDDGGRDDAHIRRRHHSMDL